MYRPPLLAPEASLYCSQIRVNQLCASWLNKIDRKGHTRLSNTWPYKTERGIYRLVNNILNSSPSVRAGNVSSLSLSLSGEEKSEKMVSRISCDTRNLVRRRVGPRAFKTGLIFSLTSESPTGYSKTRLRSFSRSLRRKIPSVIPRIRFLPKDRRKENWSIVKSKLSRRARRRHERCCDNASLREISISH